MRLIAAILLVLTTAGVAHAAAGRTADGLPSRKYVEINNVAIDSEGSNAVVSFEVAAGKKASPGNRMITITPVVVSEGRRYELTSIGVRGRGFYLSQTRRSRAAGTTVVNEGMILLENGETYTYTASLPESRLAEGSTLIFESNVRDCCYSGDSSRPGADGFVGERVEVVTPATIHRTTGDRIAANYGFVEPYPGGPVRFTDKVRDNALAVYFELGRYDLKKEYRDNDRILGQIVAAISILTRADDSEIETVMLAGFASPEGSMERNELLGRNRGLMLRDYITANTSLRADQFVMHNGGADWNGLRMMVEASDMPYRRQILDIIDNTPEWDTATGTGRMDRIKTLDGGRVYERLRREVFPELRSTAYIKVYYRNKETEK